VKLYLRSKQKFKVSDFEITNLKLQTLLKRRRLKVGERWLVSVAETSQIPEAGRRAQTTNNPFPFLQWTDEKNYFHLTYNQAVIIQANMNSIN